MQAVVIKPFDSPDGALVAGQLVDTAGWKWADKLVDQRFIRAATQEEIDTAEDVPAVSPKPMKAKKASHKKGIR